MENTDGSQRKGQPGQVYDLFYPRQKPASSIDDFVVVDDERESDQLSPAAVRHQRGNNQFIPFNPSEL